MPSSMGLGMAVVRVGSIKKTTLSESTASFLSV